MTKPHLLSAGLLFAWAGSVFAADVPAPTPPADPAVELNQPAAAQSETGEITRLQALPAHRIPLKNATLASAIRLLAEDCNLSYLSPAEADFGERISIDVMMNPYDLLRLLSEDYNFGMEYRRGVWRFYRINLNELVTKAYTLRFNNLQKVSIASSSINSQLAAFSGGGGGASGGGAGGGASSGGASGSPSGMSHSGGSGGTFDAKTGRIIEDIKKILGIPTMGLNTPTLEGSPNMPNAAADRRGLVAPAIEPIWNPDTSQLFVVATRQQHSLVAAYLKTVDQPQKLVRIAVKFVETSHNPTSTVGINWAQTFLGNGGPINLSGGNSTTIAGSTSNAGSTTTTITNGSTSVTTGGATSGASSGTLNPLGTAINLAHPGSVALPISLLSAPAFQVAMQAIAQDQNSTVVQDPVLYTSNNREVTFKATTEQPIQEGSTTFGSATAATSSQIAYIEVGTEVTVLPSVLPGRSPSQQVVLLSLSINVSTIIGQQVINGNPYPVTSTRTYSYSVPIPSGETLAIAGLEQRTHQVQDDKVPLLGDIPVLGYAFKSKSDQVIHTTLLAFITPEVMTDAAAGDVGAAELPRFRHRIFLGSKDETLANLRSSLKGLPADIATLVAVADPENRDRVLNRLDQISVELALMDVRLAEFRLDSDKITAHLNSEVATDRALLSAARDRVSGISVDPANSSLVSGP